MTHEISLATVITAAKNVGYIPAVVIGLSMENYTILALMLVIDVVTGIWRSAVIKGGVSITSWRVINGIMSKFLFLVVPITVAVMGKGLGLDLVWLAQTALGLLMIGTGYSIIGNIYGIRKGKMVKEFDVIHIILMQIQNVLEKFEGDNKDNK